MMTAAVSPVRYGVVPRGFITVAIDGTVAASPVSLKGECVIVMATSLFIPAIHWPSFSSCIILIVLASVFSGYIINLLPPLPPH